MCCINNKIQTSKSWTCSSRQFCNIVITSWQQQGRWITNRQQIHYCHATLNPSIHGHLTNHSLIQPPILTQSIQPLTEKHHLKDISKAARICITCVALADQDSKDASSSSQPSQHKHTDSSIQLVEKEIELSSRQLNYIHKNHHHNEISDTTNSTRMLHWHGWIHGVWCDTMQNFHWWLRGGARGCYWYRKAVWDWRGGG